MKRCLLCCSFAFQLNTITTPDFSSMMDFGNGHEFCVIKAIFFPSQDHFNIYSSILLNRLSSPGSSVHVEPQPIPADSGASGVIHPKMVISQSQGIISMCFGLFQKCCSSLILNRCHLGPVFFYCHEVATHFKKKQDQSTTCLVKQPLNTYVHTVNYNYFGYVCQEPFNCGCTYCNLYKVWSLALIISFQESGRSIVCLLLRQYSCFGLQPLTVLTV